MSQFSSDVTYQDRADQQAHVSAFLTNVYGWMAFALALTGGVAWITAHSQSMLDMIFGTKGVFIGLLIGEVVLVIAITAAINKISAGVAAGLFVLYAAVNGLTMAVIFLIYTEGSIATTFFVTAGTFLAMTAVGYTTKKDLTSLGNLCFMLLIGVIIGSVVNMFLGSTMMYWLITYVGIAVFIGLIAYDTQKIKAMAYGSQAGTQAAKKGAVLGALALYLDFVNLMLLLLRLLGRRR